MHSNLSKLESLIKWQLELAEKSFHISIDPVIYIEKFKENPNEAYHILDCRDFIIYMNENHFDEVFCLPGFHPKNVVEILELIHSNNTDQVFQFMELNLANETLFELGKDSVVQIFMNINEEMILKTSTPLIADDNRHVIWVLEQYRNVTGVVTRGQYTWSYKGPNAVKLTDLVKAGLKKDCPLSSQELVVLRFVGQGMSSQKTANNLFISKHTVDTHRRNILKKLNVENTALAYQRARDFGFLL